MKNLIVIIVLFTITGKHAISQTTQQFVINSSGGAYDKGRYAYEWSIGELVLVNNMIANDNRFILTNGFLQPFAGMNRVNIPAMFLDHEIRLLPNPVKDFLAVQLNTKERGKLRLYLYDELGYMRYYNELNVTDPGIVETINMIRYASAAYVLKADFINADPSKGSKSRTYKVIKTQ
jgi:hypothetical protein